MRIFFSLVLVFTIAVLAIACGGGGGGDGGSIIETNIRFAVKDETNTLSSSEEWLLCMHEVGNPTHRYCDLAVGNPREVHFGIVDAGTYGCHAGKSNDSSGNSSEHDDDIDTVTISNGDNKTILFTFYIAGYYNSPLGPTVPIREWKFEVVNN